MTRYRVRLPQAEPAVDHPPFEETPIGIVVTVVILLTLFIGTPGLLWLVAS